MSPVDWTNELSAADEWVLVANLPYNIATPMILGLLDGVPAVKRMLVMVQKEVGERFVASPRVRPRLCHVKVAYWAEARIAASCHRPCSCRRPTSILRSSRSHDATSARRRQRRPE